MKSASKIVALACLLTSLVAATATIADQETAAHDIWQQQQQQQEKRQLQTPCTLCSGGSLDLEFPSRVIPFFNLEPGNDNPTCQQLDDYARNAENAINQGDDICALVQKQAGYCGCPETENTPPPAHCNFCPESADDEPANWDTIAPSTDRCGDLHTYVKFMDPEDCASQRFESMQGLAFLCGCPNVQAACSLCPDGAAVTPAFQNKEAQPTGETCEEMEEEIQAYTPDVCEDSDTTVLVSAARCGCENSPVPVCSIQTNPHLCTHELLDQLEESDPTLECECYAFCDGAFETCHNHPGGLLFPTDCPGTPITGCNRAAARGPQTQKNTQENTEVFSASSQNLLFTVTTLGVVMTVATAFIQC